MPDALASETRLAPSLLDGRHTHRCKGRRLQVDPDLLRRPPVGDQRPRCWHSAALNLDDLPDWQWPDILAHLKCTKCGSVGWVDSRPNWGEVIDYERSVSLMRLHT
jgi:hypothetical protein